MAAGFTTQPAPVSAWVGAADGTQELAQFLRQSAWGSIDVDTNAKPVWFMIVSQHQASDSAGQQALALQHV